LWGNTSRLKPLSSPISRAKVNNMSSIDTKKAEAVASETADLSTPNANKGAVIFDLSLTSNGDHCSKVLFEAFKKAAEAAPDIGDLFDSNPFEGIGELDQVNFNCSTISQIAGRQIGELEDLQDGEIKYIYTHRSIDRSSNKGVFLVEKRSKLRTDAKVEDQVSKIFKRISYTKLEDGSFRFDDSFNSCNFKKALELSLSIISGNDFKSLIVDPILKRFRGYTYMSTSRYVFASMTAADQAELAKFCNEFINTTIPSFNTEALIFVKENANNSVAHAQKSISFALAEMVQDVENELENLKNTPTEFRKEQAMKKLAIYEEAKINFENLFKIKTIFTSGKIENMTNEIESYRQKIQETEVKEKASRPRSSKTSKTAALIQAKAVIENQQNELEKLKAELAAMKLLQAKKEAKTKAKKSKK